MGTTVVTDEGDETSGADTATAFAAGHATAVAEQATAESEEAMEQAEEATATAAAAAESAQNANSNAWDAQDAVAQLRSDMMAGFSSIADALSGLRPTDTDDTETETEGGGGDHSPPEEIEREKQPADDGRYGARGWFG